MRVVQALHWLHDLIESDRHLITRRLATILADPLHGHEIVADLRRGLTSLPEWMQSFLEPLLDATRKPRKTGRAEHAGWRP
jgi:hypothetical protein